MEFEDYLEPEVAIAAAVAAVVFSPKGRQLLRRGAVYGLAGALVAGESIASVARGVGQGFKAAGAAAAQATSDGMQQAAEQPPQPREGQAQ
jgi:hypothetical protein